VSEGRAQLTPSATDGAESIDEFRRVVLDHWKEEGRIFPWREDLDPWGILLSEFMLQQTQTERVIAYWTRWKALWPSPGALAEASLEDVLREWSGLGYNRRARFIRNAAIAIRDRFGGQVPRMPEDLEILDGIGPYTARAISTFAYGEPNVFIETNIRAAAIHFFFPNSESVRDADLLPLLAEALDREDPRRWYWALMDYGAALKKVTKNPSRRSAHYTRQSPFAGSLRQARGAVLRFVTRHGACDEKTLVSETGIEAERLYLALSSLKKEGFLSEKGGVYLIKE